VSDINANAWVSSGHRPMGFPEFVVVIASIMALNPLAMDMMLPALPNISSAFHIAVANRPQMVLSIFLVGFGVGQFVMGPLSDRFGAAADAVARHFHRADAVWRGGAGLERVADAGDAAGFPAQVAGHRRGV